LQFVPPAEEAMPHDGLDFIFCLAFDHLWRRWIVIGSVFRSFTIGSQQGGMKDVMDGPGGRETQLIGDR
jgi:hypothetical protein